MGCKVTQIKKIEEGVAKVEYEDLNGKISMIEASAILIGIGRKPYFEGLNINKIGIEVDQKGRIKVDNQFNTSIDSIKAIGDVIHGPMLAHKAEEEGIAAVQFIIDPTTSTDHSVIPSVIYTHPEVAWVGKNEEELNTGSLKFRSSIFPFSANSRARTNGKDSLN